MNSSSSVMDTFEQQGVSNVEPRVPTANKSFSRVMTYQRAKRVMAWSSPTLSFLVKTCHTPFIHVCQKMYDTADLLLVMGTSLLVAPVSMIPDMVQCQRVLLNRECVGNFDAKRGDVVFEGDCDDAVYMLAKELGWEKELLELNEKTRIGERKDNTNVSDDNEKKKKKEEEVKETEESLEDLCGLGDNAQERQS